VLIGRGPGLLSGAAIALSPTPLLLPIMAAEITKLTFRFGLVVDQVCRSSEVSPDEINAEGVSKSSISSFALNFRCISVEPNPLTWMFQAWVYCAYGADLKEAQQAVAEFNSNKVST
jgi:hypothetical protein